jgi:glutathione S-transferase
VPKLKLSYFDFDGGRGEPARIALSMGGIDFEDDRIPPSEWPAHREATPFGALPVLEVDGVALAQSNGINRYVGKLAGLYPEDALQAGFCDEAMDAAEDIGVPIVATFGMEPDEQRQAREALVAGSLPFLVERLGRRLDLRGGEWFADGRLTVADLRVFVWLRHMRSGALDHIPHDLADRVAPQLAAHCDRVAAHPGVKAYYAKRGAA